MITSSNEVRVTKRFVVLAVAYACVLLLSNILANKIIMPFGYVLPCAVVLFPIVYIISDLMTEVYGIKLSKLAIKANACMNLFMSLIFMVAITIPSAPFADSTAFDTILGSTPRMVFASLVSYFIGDMVNSHSLSFFKAKFSNVPFLNLFLFRSIFSSMLGQVFDTIGFIAMAFYGTVPNDALLQMMGCQYVVKIGYQVVVHPLMHFIVTWWKNAENLDIVDEW